MTEDTIRTIILDEVESEIVSFGEEFVLSDTFRGNKRYTVNLFKEVCKTKFSVDVTDEEVWFCGTYEELLDECVSLVMDGADD